MAKKNESAFDIEEDDFDSMFESSLSFAEEAEDETDSLTKPQPAPEPEPEPQQVAEPEPDTVAEPAAVEETTSTEEPEPVQTAPEPELAPEPASGTSGPDSSAEHQASVFIDNESDVPEPATIVSPEPPLEGSEENVVRIPTMEGVEYVIGDDAYEGEVEVPEAGLTILAYPLAGYVLDDSVDIEWSFDFIAPPPQKTAVMDNVEESDATGTVSPPIDDSIRSSDHAVSSGDIVDEKSSELSDNTSGGFDPNASQADNLKSGVDKDVSLETLEQTIKILDAYRSLEDDEAQFSGLFIGLDHDSTEAEVVSTVMNADPLLMSVFASIKEAKNYDDTEVAFYVVGLKWEVLEGISYVAAQYLNTEVASQGDKSKIPYAREVVTQIKELDSKALRLVEAAESLIAGEIRDNDADLSH